MASSSGRKAESQKSRPLHVSKSFSRLETAGAASPSRSSRANTIQNVVIQERQSLEKENVSGSIKRPNRSESFDKSTKEDKKKTATEEVNGRSPIEFDELPIELKSLTDNFVESLSAKAHPTPPTIDKISILFQEFYALSAGHINTHISTLSSRQHRESSPSSVSSRSSAASRIRAKASSISSKERPKLPLERNDSEQQMLTAEEIADRKKARKVLEHKRVALEEAVEKRVCEEVYERIWRHRSTQDEPQDDKLRSKTAALAVVGIGLADLGIDLGEATSDKDKEQEIREWLDGARDELLSMNDKKYPLGKLQHLKAAHKAIVDTLSHFHPSSSADEIMPMLIYTLITSADDGTNVISNLYFIQRFRSHTKIDGEAAYCLTNLEAAITFLETVDLASLRADEVLSGPSKTSDRPFTPMSDKTTGTGTGTVTMPSPGLSSPGLSPAIISSTSSQGSIVVKSQLSPTSLRPAIQVHNRRLSDLFQTPAQAVGAAGDAVLNTADHGFKSIGNSLGESYKFLVGKLRERENDSPDGHGTDVIVPKTLDDARKLVGTPPPEEEGSISGASSLHGPEDNTDTHSTEASSKLDDKVLTVLGVRRPARDHSADSARSSGSGKKVAFAEEHKEKGASPLSTAAALTATNPLESMRSLGNSFNPMNRLAGMGMMRGFGRNAAPVALAPTSVPSTSAKDIPDGGVTDLASAFPDLVPSLPPKEKEIAKVAPPIKRFMEVQNPGDLKISEVLDLLRDYRRLAGALKDLGAL